MNVNCNVTIATKVNRSRNVKVALFKVILQHKTVKLKVAYIFIIGSDCGNFNWPKEKK